MVRKREGRKSANPKPKPTEEDPKPNPIIRNLKSSVVGCSATTIVPSSLKDVLLHDWWLVKVRDGKGEGLAVGGFTFRERVGLRVIRSAEISERHEATILKAKDGITFTISGFINRSRTMENGFPPEVCSRFLLGFPFDWKDYVPSCRGSPRQKIKTRLSDSESNVSSGNSRQDLADQPVTRIRDLLLSTHENSCYSLLMDSFLQDSASGKSRSCGGVSTRSMSRMETRKTASIDGQTFEERALPPEKTTKKTQSGSALGVTSKARISNKNSSSTTDFGRRSSLKTKNKKQ